jgi:hypothetical protein
LDHALGLGQRVTISLIWKVKTGGGINEMEELPMGGSHFSEKSYTELQCKICDCLGLKKQTPPFYTTPGHSVGYHYSRSCSIGNIKVKTNSNKGATCILFSFSVKFYIHV